MIGGREFLDVAEFLESMEGEASAGARTGHAYYAAFLEARSFCELATGYSRSKSSREHAEVARLLGRFDPELSANLTFLRQHRNAADYEIELSTETIVKQAERARELAAIIITRLDELAATIPVTKTDPS